MENKDLQAIDDAVEKQAEVLVEQEMERQNVDSKSDGAKPAMKVKDLYFSYGKNKVLKGVSLQIAAGKITTILGANGQRTFTREREISSFPERTYRT